MNILLSLLAQIMHLGLMVVAAPTIAGLIGWLSERLTGRTGPSPLLTWRILVRLSLKSPMRTESVSIASQLAPAVSLGATLSVVALVPSFTLGMTLAPMSDVVVVVALLSLAQAAAVLAALDAGAPLPGLAAQRASAVAVLAEPALMLCMLALALMGGSFNLDLIISQQRDGLLLPAAASAVVLTALLALGFTDATSGHADLDQMSSGKDLAISKMTGWLRRLIWFNLIGGLFFPVGMATAANGPLDWLTGLASWVARTAVFVVLLCGIQTFLGRVPRHSLNDLIGVAALLAVLAMMMIMAASGTA
jgi:formate hydrogenlyase subunit 4